MQKELGGQRIGNSNKMHVNLKAYERSTHNLGYIWSNTQSVGTLVPFLTEIGLPGDTFDIKLGCDVKTHPTLGPLFGSMKVELHVFKADMRLYIRALHNNKLNIGRAMSSVLIPQYKMNIPDETSYTNQNINSAVINKSCILNYLGNGGYGLNTGNDTGLDRSFEGLFWLMYADTYKNYYANKQEEEGVVIHSPSYPALTITSFQIDGQNIPTTPTGSPITVTTSSEFVLDYTGTAPQLEQILFNINGQNIPASSIATNIVNSIGEIVFHYNGSLGASIGINYYSEQDVNIIGEPKLVRFPLSDIDDMREAILGANTTLPFYLNDQNLSPWQEILNTQTSARATQEGLLIKTYDSDIFNNWVNTTWIDDVNSASQIDIAASGSILKMDTLNIQKKVYEYLMRVTVGDGTYDTWKEVTYDHQSYFRAETPVFEGALLKQLVFQEVISQAAAPTPETNQPLGTLAGRGVMSNKHTGGEINIKCDDPCMIMGLVSITPVLTYSQGNRWYVNLKNLDQLHKPVFDQIGFGDLITEKMAWWATTQSATQLIQTSAGKQPAWIDYMTNYNRSYGNFAIENNEMFMTLNRRYQFNGDNVTPSISDLTTYIDPVKFNYIFAQTSLDAMNYWVNIGVNMTARRKMSASLMPVI